MVAPRYFVFKVMFLAVTHGIRQVVKRTNLAIVGKASAWHNFSCLSGVVVVAAEGEKQLEKLLPIGRVNTKSTRMTSPQEACWYRNYNVEGQLKEDRLNRRAMAYSRSKMVIMRILTVRWFA